MHLEADEYIPAEDEISSGDDIDNEAESEDSEYQKDRCRKNMRPPFSTKWIDLDPRLLTSLTLFEGKKYFLNHVFEEDLEGLHCGFPNCIFKVPAPNEGQSAEEEMMEHINIVHFPEKAARPPLHRPCRICETTRKDTRTYNRKGYRNHMRKCHPEELANDPDAKGIVICPVCERPVINSLTSHRWTHFSYTEKAALRAQGFQDPRLKPKFSLRITPGSKRRGRPPTGSSGKHQKESPEKKPKLPNKNFDLNPRTLTGLFHYKEKTFFLNYVFEEDFDSLNCGYPNCDFKIIKQTDQSQSDVEKLMMQHIEEMHFRESISAHHSLRPCPLCNDEVKYTRKDYRQHMFILHPEVADQEDDGWIWICEICGKPCRAPPNEHKWSHFSTLEAEVLKAQGFPDPREKERLKKKRKKEILKNDVGEIEGSKQTSHSRRFTCPECGKVFNYASGLSAHKRAHRFGKEQFICEVCGVIMTTKRGIDLHRKRVHQPDLMKWHVCLICDKKFVVKTHLENHVARRHSSEKRFVCEKCGLKCSTIDALKKHNIAHMPSGYRPHNCSLCGMSYRYSGGLARHKQDSHNINKKPPNPTCQRKYPCGKCRRIFDRPSHLKKHIAEKHSEPEDMQMQEEKIEEEFIGFDVD